MRWAKVGVMTPHSQRGVTLVLTWEYADDPLRKTGRRRPGNRKPSGASGDVVAGLGLPCRRLNTSVADDNCYLVQETESTGTLGEIVRRWGLPNEVVPVPVPVPVPDVTAELIPLIRHESAR